MVSEPGTVSAINNQLIVRTDSATMRAVEAIVERLDIARVNRKVSFKFNQDTQSQYANTGVTVMETSKLASIETMNATPSGVNRRPSMPDSANNGRNTRTIIAVA